MRWTARTRQSIVCAMAKAGDVIEIPRTGEKAVFLQTAADTNGELLQMEFQLKPGSSPKMHIHLDVDERIEVIAGRVRVKVGKEERVLGPGEAAELPRGKTHTFYPEDGEMLRMIVEVRPARDFETLFETVFGLYRDGKTSRFGGEALLQGAVLGRANNTYIAGIPIVVQRILFVIVAPVARLFGHRPRYDRYSSSG